MREDPRHQPYIRFYEAVEQAAFPPYRMTPDAYFYAMQWLGTILGLLLVGTVVLRLLIKSFGAKIRNLRSNLRVLDIREE